MNTQTISTVISHFISLIGQLTPGVVASRPFKLNGAPNFPLRTWALDVGGNDIFRYFEVKTEGEREDIGVQHPTATFCNVLVRITLSYPRNPKLLNLDENYELEAVMAADAYQIRDRVYSTAGLCGSGHQANMVKIIQPDRTSNDIWFQDLDVTAKFFVAQNL